MILIVSLLLFSTARSDPQVNLHCNTDILESYGLAGVKVPSPQSHKYCPLIQNSCCSQADEDASYAIWTKSYMPRLKKWYETYLYSTRYLLGFSAQGCKLATDLIEGGTSEECRKSADTLSGLGLTPEMNLNLYQALVAGLEKIADLRRGFFCTLCDGKFHEEIGLKWNDNDPFYVNRLFYSKNFCRKLVESTITASFFNTFYLEKYGVALAQVISCKVKEPFKFNSDIDAKMKQHIKNCYYFRDKYFFFFCERYCESFFLTRSSSVLEGEISQLRGLVQHIKSHREDAFESPNQNSMINPGEFEQHFQNDYFGEILNESVLFPPLMDKKPLDKLLTDVVYTGGYDPFISAEGNFYPIYLGAGLVDLLLGAIFFILC